ncbi:hypothetical protein G7Y89_g12649 [Cudoniella acicularis]|uniref:Uncharacterized protein n=1 Tax=Cudoniella acicularis TaxID=354080 RepID=A0A8H4R8Q9_9HELO|nr:hypothetical protein G7Y89_g12649 [Cudoniella acicularis]
MEVIPQNKPDLVVGIDFGMTYTGVAWTNLQNSIQSLDDWPGLLDAHQVKVPTRFIRGKDNSWGFLVDNDEAEESERIEEFFKIYLDQRSIDIARRNGLQDIPANVAEAQRLTAYFLQQIYQHIKHSIESSTGGSWQNKTVEFNFSMPTTWVSLNVLNNFEEAVRASGFGEENRSKHVVNMGLTEAEAAAVYVASNPQVRFMDGDVLLVCDAGGGTTDLGLVQVENAKLPTLKQVNAVSGVGIGSTLIDNSFELLVQARLDSHPDGNTLSQNLARKIARSTQFQSFKHKFGSAVGDFPEYKFKLDILGLNISQNFSHPGLGIERGRIIFSKAELQALFDTQIRGIVKKIDEQLDWMQTNQPGQQVKYLILSGGLGGSDYVKTRLEGRYGSTDMSIVRSQEPRLSVVKGLVMDRKQKLILGTAALKSRIARASYGVACRQIYDPIRHPGATIEYDAYTKKRWAINQIDWLIKKGDMIDTNTAKEKPFSKKIRPGDPSRQWDTQIIISHNDRDKLPRNLNEAGAHTLCNVQSDLKEVHEKEFELKNKRFWQGRKYYDAIFQMKFLIGPADLKFEIWFNGVKYNRSHEAVKVEWDSAGVSARPSEYYDPDSYERYR